MDEDYLQPGFDPNTLTVPRLRSILVAHEVSYPASAKKPQLIELFNQHVLPQARKLLNSRTHTKRSTRGIVDIPSTSTSQASTVEEQEEPETVTTSRSFRRVARADIQGDDDDRRTSRRTTTRISREPERSLDGAADVRPSSRRTTRHSSAVPILAQEDSVPKTWREYGGESPFSNDNPFQSASSPPAESRYTDKASRRKTLGVSPEKDMRRGTSGSRRRTDGFRVQEHDEDLKPSVSQRVDMPLAVLKKKPKKKSVEPEPEPEFMEPGEEFTPEEEMALTQESEQKGQLDVLPPRRKPARQASNPAKNALLAVFLSTLLGLTGFWRQAKLEVGYCGQERPGTALAQVPQWAEVYEPKCESCPPHAICYPHLETACDQDFILKPHPLSLGGLVPLPPTCEPDSEKSRKVKAVGDRAVEELRVQNAKAECGDLVDEHGKHVRSNKLSENVLKATVSGARSKVMTQAEFDDLWRTAIEEVVNRDEIIHETDEQGNRILASKSLARIPLSCAIRRSIRLTLERNLWKLVAFLSVISSAGYGRRTITQGRATEEKAKQLASYALDRLATQAAQHLVDPDVAPEAWMSMAQLRDDLLRDEFSASKRAKLWEKVQKKVEQNSNVRPGLRENDRTGDVSRAWEWIGPVQALEGAPSTTRSKVTRHSNVYGGEADYSSPIKKEDTPATKAMIQSRKWDEGRPVY